MADEKAERIRALLAPPGSGRATPFRVRRAPNPGPEGRMPINPAPPAPTVPASVLPEPTAAPLLPPLSGGEVNDSGGAPTTRGKFKPPPAHWITSAGPAHARLLLEKVDW